MIHGFTGSPSEFRRIGYILRDEGYTIQALRLPGHGTSPEDMRRTGWTDWYGHVLESYDELAARCKRVVIMGHSMGGLLALKLGGERAAAGIISLATPFFFTTRKLALAGVMQYVLPYIEKKPKKISTLLDESCAYTKTPIRCVVSLRKLVKEVKKLLPRVDAPIWIGQGNKDGIVHPSSAVYLRNSVGSQVTKLHFYKESSHGLLLDQEREQIYADISAFILSQQVAYYGVRDLRTAD
ncbi:alpha/beta fold hydrolase [Paenibacillus sp. LMG 31461]|uniref:Alpha/beta fold hydrolase n=1 Tax=Paenibacillus plantarum TaxID=2654975 RepID=A0ABX1X5R4_9BACL|nr:alpha/beta fold hydrolase [Paenibacillus plantarum]NOU63561.1 alpha/beta fold hydrolase [Paenibacillus plantarum]